MTAPLAYAIGFLVGGILGACGVAILSLRSATLCHDEAVRRDAMLFNFTMLLREVRTELGCHVRPGHPALLQIDRAVADYWQEFGE